MDWEKATRIAYAIGKSKLAEMRMAFFRAAADYARLRVEWQIAGPAEKSALDPTRTEAHDTFIRTCDMLERVMGEQGEDVSWRKELGEDRKEIGDFACYINLILGLSAR